MGKLIHFEIPTTNPEKACDFYSKVFGWKFSKWGEMPYWLADTGPRDEPGIWGALTMKSGYNQNVVNTIEIKNAEDTMDDVLANGGEVLTEKMTVPGVGWFFYFKDPDGNIHGAMQSDPDAK